jgi:hypothetical protein
MAMAAPEAGAAEAGAAEAGAAGEGAAARAEASRADGPPYEWPPRKMRAASIVGRPSPRPPGTHRLATWAHSVVACTLADDS